MAKPKNTKKARTAEDKDLCRLITPEFRVSYPHVFKPQAPKPTDTPKYSITMLFPKDKKIVGSSPDGQPRSLVGAMKAAKTAEFGDPENWPEDLLSPVINGDDPKYADKDGYKGHWVVKAVSSADQRPTVVDRDMSVITNPADLYPGCYARAYVFAYVWEYMGKQGIGFILDHVQKLRDGKSFGGKKPVEQVFSPVAAAADDEDGDEDESAEENF